jgi:hypothetical protein
VVERQQMMVIVVVMLIALDADLDDLFEDGGVLPADGCEASRWIEDGDGLDCLQTDADTRDVAGGWDVEFDETSHDLVVGHGRPLVALWQWAIGWVQEDGILKQVELELAGLEEGGEHGCACGAGRTV